MVLATIGIKCSLSKKKFDIHVVLIFLCCTYLFLAIVPRVPSTILELINVTNELVSVT